MFYARSAWRWAESNGATHTPLVLRCRQSTDFADYADFKAGCGAMPGERRKGRVKFVLTPLICEISVICG